MRMVTGLGRLTSDRSLEDAELIPGVVGHAGGGPGRGHDEADFRFGHAGELLQSGFGLMNDLRTSGAAGAGEGHFDLDFALVTLIDGVDQAQIDNVDEQLGVDDGAECLDHLLFVGVEQCRTGGKLRGTSCGSGSLDGRMRAAAVSVGMGCGRLLGTARGSVDRNHG